MTNSAIYIRKIFKKGLRILLNPLPHKKSFGGAGGLRPRTAALLQILHHSGKNFVFEGGDEVNPSGAENCVFKHARFSFGNPRGGKNSVFDHTRFCSAKAPPPGEKFRF
jgi:hypothetical protein